MSQNRLSAKHLAIAGFEIDREESRQSGTKQYVGPTAYSQDRALGAFLRYNKVTGVQWVIDTTPEATYTTDQILEFLFAIAELAAPFGRAS